MNYYTKKERETKERKDRADLLAHLCDIFSSKEEVLKPLVAHFEHAGGERTERRGDHKHEVNLRVRERRHSEIKTH